MTIQVQVLGASLSQGVIHGLAGARVEEHRGTHITGQLLIVFHKLFILLIDGQHFADAIGCCFRLETR